jgi:hypothetical protein
MGISPSEQNARRSDTLFDLRTGKLLLHETLPFCPQAIAFSRGGTRLATAGGVGAFDLRVWDVLGVSAPSAPFAR